MFNPPTWTPPTGGASLRRIEVAAPAKVNLYLGVHPLSEGEGPGGRHLTDTVMHAISLTDTLVASVYPATEGDSELFCNCSPDMGLPAEENLAYRAVVGLARALGREHVLAPGYRLQLDISKQIPAQAGLGGGSSDAAAALLALSTLYELDPTGPEVLGVAQKLGSDVPFFLYGACARMAGCGEQLAEVLEPLTGPLVVVKPSAGVSTGEAYKTFDSAPPELPGYQPLRQALALDTHPSNQANRLAHAALAMGNNLAPAAEQLLPELARIRSWLAEQPRVLAAQLSGSGSATFAICGTDTSAFEVAAQAQEQGWYAMPAWFAGRGAHVVEDRRSV